MALYATGMFSYWFLKTHSLVPQLAKLPPELCQKLMAAVRTIPFVPCPFSSLPFPRESVLSGGEHTPDMRRNPVTSRRKFAKS